MGTLNRSNNTNTRHSTAVEHPEGSASEQLQARFRTEAEVVTASEFLIRKERENRVVVGVEGFTGRWSEKNLASDRVLSERHRFAQAELEDVISDLHQRFGERLLIARSSGSVGVPKMVSEICKDRGIETVGVTSSAGPKTIRDALRYLVVEGSNREAGSEAFLKIVDKVVLLGGGEQSKRVAIVAANEGKPVIVIQGFGGAADELRGNIVKALGTPDTLEAQLKEGRINATFIDCGRQIERSRD